MIARIRTHLPTSADHAWRLLVRRDTFLYVTRGLLGFTGARSWPEEFHEGREIRTRLVFFHLIPAWEHHVRVVLMDEARYEVRSEEHGGPIRIWEHRIRLQPESAARCCYTDEIELHAGPLTPVVWLLAHLFYRYRQMRWRRMLRQLARARLLRV